MNGAGIDFKAHDIWLVGCLLVHMLTGLEPFDTSAICAQKYSLLARYMATYRI